MTKKLEVVRAYKLVIRAVGALCYVAVLAKVALVVASSLIGLHGSQFHMPGTYW